MAARRESVCEKCGRVFGRAWLLTRHQKRKTPCSTTVERRPVAPKTQCEFCYRTFASPSNKQKHIRTSCKTAPSRKNEERFSLYETALKQQQRQINAMLEILGPANHGTPVNVNYGTQVFVNSVTVGARTHFEFNIFGGEKVDHITPSIIRELLEQFASRRNVRGASEQFLVEVAHRVYSNPDVPENYTCYIKNARAKTAMVYEKAGWVHGSLSAVVASMVKKTVDIIFENQPPDKKYRDVLREILANEEDFCASRGISDLLIKNKALVAQMVKKNPALGEAPYPPALK